MNIDQLTDEQMIASGTHPLSFADLRSGNLARCEDAFHPIRAWSPTDWMCAVVGEAANLIKKGRRGEPVAVAAIATEIADAVIYLDLLAARLGIDLGAAVTSKFNVVSLRRGSPVRLRPTTKGPGCPANLIYQADPAGGFETGPTTTSRKET